MWQSFGLLYLLMKCCCCKIIILNYTVIAAMTIAARRSASLLEIYISRSEAERRAAIVIAATFDEPES